MKNTANKMQMVDKVLKYANRNNTLTYFGVHPDGYIVDRRDKHNVSICNKPYFFLKQEVEAGITPKNVRRLSKDGWLRHLTLTADGRYYDYIIHKYFDSIFDWVESCGCDITDVLFGQNHTYKPNGQLMCVGLLDLLWYIHGEYSWEYYGVYKDEESEYEEEEESDYEEEDEESDDEMPPLVPVEVVVPQPPPPRGLTSFEKIITVLWVLSLLNVLITNYEVGYDLHQFYLNATLTNSSF